MNFVFSHLNLIILIIWFLFLIIVALRFFYPTSFKNISFLKLAMIALGIHIFYGLFVSWGQYYVWSTTSDITRFFISSPLSSQVVFPAYLEWIRPLFNNHLGYFLYYILGRIWLNIFITFVISGFLYLVFKIWNSYRGNFTEQGPEFLLVLMLISGFPGVFVSIILGFVVSVLLLIFFYFKGNIRKKIEPIFIFTTFIALLFTNIILYYVL